MSDATEGAIHAATRPAEARDPADVAVGDRLGPLIKHPTTRQLVMFAGASGDLYEIHYDDEIARAGGLPGVIIHGYLKMAWLGELVTAWAGPDAVVRRLDVSYRGIDLPGDDYILDGEVTAIAPADHGTAVTVEVWGEGAAGVRTTLGEAVVLLAGT
jgi:acyl dehydratase